MSTKHSNDTIRNRSRELPVCSAVTEMSTRNNFWGLKVAAPATLPLHVPIVLKSGSLKLLETYGLVQTSFGIALACFVHNKERQVRCSEYRRCPICLTWWGGDLLFASKSANFTEALSLSMNALFFLIFKTN
jgi:hypothetical protein